MNVINKVIDKIIFEEKDHLCIKNRIWWFGSLRMYHLSDKIPNKFLFCYYRCWSNIIQ